MVDISLKEFIKTGEFGPVRLGMTREELQDALGPPDDWGGTSRKRRTPPILRYGFFEFYFDYEPRDNVLYMVHFDRFDQEDALRGCASFTLDPWIVQPNMAADRLLAGLRSVGIQCSEYHSPLNPPDCVCVRVESGVEFLFSVEADEFGSPAGLYAIRLIAPWAQGPRKPNVKQVSVALPLDTFARIKAEARKRRTSIARLCSGWIEDRAAELPDDAD